MRHVIYTDLGHVAARVPAARDPAYAVERGIERDTRRLRCEGARRVALGVAAAAARRDERLVRAARPGVARRGTRAAGPREPVVEDAARLLRLAREHLSTTACCRRPRGSSSLSDG